MSPRQKRLERKEKYNVTRESTGKALPMATIACSASMLLSVYNSLLRCTAHLFHNSGGPTFHFSGTETSIYSCRTTNYLWNKFLFYKNRFLGVSNRWLLICRISCFLQMWVYCNVPFMHWICIKYTLLHSQLANEWNFELCKTVGTSCSSPRISHTFGNAFWLWSHSKNQIEQVGRFIA